MKYGPSGDLEVLNSTTRELINSGKPMHRLYDQAFLSPPVCEQCTNIDLTSLIESEGDQGFHWSFGAHGIRG